MSLLRILLLGALLTTPASAEVLFRVEVSPSGVALPEGDRGMVSVRVVSDERVGQPMLKIEGGELMVEGGGQSSFQFQNLGLRGGRQRYDRTHRFEVAGVPGKYTIKAVVKNQRGEEYESESVELSIRELSDAEKDRQPELHIRLKEQAVYVGQAIDAEVLVLPKNRSRLITEANNSPKFSGDGFKASTVGRPYDAEPFNGLAAAAYGAIVTPLKPGPISISATFQPVIGVRSVTGLVRQKRFTLESEPVEITAKALPTEGKPSDFSGAIGSFDLSIQADPLELDIGEPIALRLTVSGQGNFDFVSTPKMTKDGDWKQYKSTRMDVQRSDDGSPDRLVFAQNIVPESNLSVIPPFRLSVFDPSKAEYVTLMTDPIQIQVKGTATPPTSVAADSSTGGTSNIIASATPPPSAELTDILIATGAAAPNWASSSTPSWRSASYWWINGGLVGALLVLAAVSRLYGKTRTPAVAAEDFNSLLGKVSRADLDGEEFYAVANRCLEAWRSTSPNTEIADSEGIAAIEQRHDFLTYAGGASTTATAISPEERERTIAALRALPQSR